jgi:hypothetical protein
MVDLGQTSSFVAPVSNGREAPIPAGLGLLTALTLTAMGRLPKVLPAIR